MKCLDCGDCVKECHWRVCDLTGAQVLPSPNNRDDPAGFPCPRNLVLARPWGQLAAQAVVKSACERGRFDALLGAYKTVEERQSLQDIRLLVMQGRHATVARLRELVACL